MHLQKAFMNKNVIKIRIEKTSAIKETSVTNCVQQIKFRVADMSPALRPRSV